MGTAATCGSRSLEGIQPSKKGRPSVMGELPIQFTVVAMTTPYGLVHFRIASDSMRWRTSQISVNAKQYSAPIRTRAGNVYVVKPDGPSDR
jgi:hypothetical protein